MPVEIPRWLLTTVLLIGSNTFMTFAWYFHLRKESWNIMQAIALSWLIAFFEYCLQVPANRYGHVSRDGPFTAPQLKVLQESISLSVFAIFSVLVLKERLRLRDAMAFGLIFLGVVVAMTGPPAVPPPDPHHAHVPDHIVRHRKMQTVEEQQIVPLASVALGLPMELPWEYDLRRPETKTSFRQLPMEDDDEVLDDAQEMMVMAVDDQAESTSEALSMRGDDDEDEGDEEEGDAEEGQHRRREHEHSA